MAIGGGPIQEDTRLAAVSGVFPARHSEGVGLHDVPLNGQTARRRLLVTGALVSAVILVCSLAGFVVQEGGLGWKSQTELVGKYGYGRYNGLAPDEIHDQVVAKDPHSLVYYNIFSGKAVKPHRWLLMDDYSVVLRKAFEAIKRLKRNEAVQDEDNHRWIRESGELDKKFQQVKNEASEARTRVEKELRHKMMKGVDSAEEEGFSKLDDQKAKLKAQLDAKETDLRRMLDEAERATDTRLDALRKHIERYEDFSNETMFDLRGRIGDAEQNLTVADMEERKALADLGLKVSAASAKLLEDSDALAQDLLKAKLALAAEVDTSVQKLRAKMRTMILEVRVIILHFLRLSQHKIHTVMGVVGADLHSKYKRLDGVIKSSSKKEDDFARASQSSLLRSKDTTRHLEHEVTEGRLHVLGVQLKGMIDEISKTMQKLRSEQKAGALFLERAADKSLGGVKAQLKREQHADDEAMLRAKQLLVRAEAAMDKASQGRFWQMRDNRMSEIRSGLSALLGALGEVSKLRVSATSDREGAVQGAEKRITHGYVAQYWWLYGPEAGLPALYSPPHRQAVLEVVGMTGANVGGGREAAGRGGLPVGDEIGVAARFFGLFDAPLNGRYTFYLSSSGEARMWVDGEMMVSMPAGKGVREVQDNRVLTAGPHTLWVEYVSRQGGGKVGVEWSGPRLVRQELNGWHSAAEPGWQTQLFFLDQELDRIPQLAGVKGDREGVTTVLDYSGWVDWNRALGQEAMLPASVAAQNKIKMLQMRQTTGGSSCIGVSSSPLQAMEGEGMSCDEGVLGSVSFISEGCADEGAAKVNYTCLDVPIGACAENLGACLPIESGSSNGAWEAKCSHNEALSALRLHHVGCGEGERRLAWKCCAVSGGAYDANRETSEEGGACQSGARGAVQITSSCGSGKSLESWSATGRGCRQGDLRVSAVCADLPQEQMPVGRVAASFWGFVRSSGWRSYVVGVESAGGSKIFVDGRTVVDNDGLHDKRTRSAGLSLPSGSHIISAEWFQNKGLETLRVWWQRSGGPQEPLKVWHYAPPVVAEDLKTSHLAGGVLMFLGNRESYVQEANFVRFPKDAFTLAGWILPAPGAHGEDGVLISYRKASGPLLVEMRKSESVTAYILGSTIDSGVSVADGVWHHLAITWSAAEGRFVLYIDGDPVLVRLDVAKGKSIQNGGCLAIGQHVRSDCGDYADDGSYEGSMGDVFVASGAFSGDRIRGALMERQWTSSQVLSDTVWAITRRQARPEDYVKGPAKALCSRDVSPLSQWATSAGVCVDSLNVQWRSPHTLDREQNTRNRGPPRLLQITGHGRAAVVRQRFTRMPTRELTVSLWVKVSSGGREGILFSYGEPTVEKPLLEIAYPSALQFSILGTDVPTMISVSDGRWHHVAFTWDSEKGAGRVYVEGQELLWKVGVAQGLFMPAGGCLALGVGFRSVCATGSAAKAQEAFDSQGLVAQIGDVLVFSKIMSLGYIKASMHSEMPSSVGRRFLRLSVTGRQYGDVQWLPHRPIEVRRMGIRQCARNGGLRSMFFSAGTYKGLSECRFRCPLLVGDVTVLRTLDSMRTLEVHARMVGVSGGQLSFADAVGVRYLSDSVTLSGSGTGDPYYIIDGQRIREFPAISRLGVRVICVKGNMIGCTQNTSLNTLFQVYSPDGSLVSFWSLNGLWGGYEVQLPLNCYANKVEGLAGTISLQARDFAVGGNGEKFDGLADKCAAKGPLSETLQGVFDGGSDRSDIAKWCESWAVSKNPILYDRRGRKTVEPAFSKVSKAVSPPPPRVEGRQTALVQQNCDVLQDRPAWFESCKSAESNWGSDVGVRSLLLAKGVSQELRSLKPNAQAIRDSSGNGQDLEGRGMELGGDGVGLIEAKRTEPFDLRPYVIFPEHLSLWGFSAAPIEEGAAMEGSGACWSLERSTCIASKACLYKSTCGCIPWDCSCGDFMCIRNGGNGLARTGPKGWCSRWYFNPLGGQQILSLPDLKRLNPQKALVIPAVEFVRDSDFTAVSGIDHFDRVAMSVDGTVSIGSEGMYTVCVTSDDGSHVYVDGYEIAAKPGLHPPQTGCGTRYFARGDHFVYATFFENGGGAYLKITYKGPDTGGQEIVMPSVGFEGECEAPVAKCEPGVGWCGRFYFNPNGHGEVRTFPDIAKLVPQEAKTMLTIGYVHDAQISSMIGRVGSFDHVAAEFVGVLHINQAGTYTVCVTSDDGSALYIDGQEATAAPGLHPPLRRCKDVQLAEGDHSTRVTYFENGGGAAIQVTYYGADTNGKEVLMPSVRHTDLPTPSGSPVVDPTTAATVGGLCKMLRRTECKATDSCKFHTACGCIPKKCSCGDSQCINSQEVSSSSPLAFAAVRGTSQAVELSRAGPTGWCSKWYFNPLGGSQILSFPDITDLQPQKAIVIPTIEFTTDSQFTAVSGIKHFDRVAMTLSGTVIVEKRGEYEVCVTSDDGAWVYVDGDEIASKPGLHPPQKGCGKRYLSDGEHGVYATFFENGGGAYVKVTYNGPDTGGKEVLMPSVGFDGDCVVFQPKCECGAGWCGRFFFDPNGHEEVRSFPDIGGLIAQEAKSFLKIDYWGDHAVARMVGRDNIDHVAIELKGVLRINVGGEYTVCTTSDDGSRVLIDGQSVAAAPGLHGPLKRCGNAWLKSGDHDAKVEFFENRGGAVIKVTYSGPDTKGQEVLMPSTRHSCEASSSSTSGAVSVRAAVARPGPSGWCSRWYYNPLGGQGIGSFPDVRRLAPQRALVIPDVSFVRDADFTKVSGIQHFDRVAMTVDGILSIIIEGEYEVCVTSDDGSHVYVDGAEIVAKPGLHPPQKGCGKRYLSPGDHGVFVTFFENGGGAYLKITYAGLDTNGEEVVMPSVGFSGECAAPIAQCDCGAGWCVRFYFDPLGHEQLLSYPDTSKLIPQEARTVLLIDYITEAQISKLIKRVGYFDKVATEFLGVLHVNLAGRYNVCVWSDDGSWVYIDDKLAVSDPGLHGVRKRCGDVDLDANDHDVKLTFFENYGGAGIRLQYSGPDTGGREVMMPSVSHTCRDRSSGLSVEVPIGKACSSMRRTECKATLTCSFHTACGCIPKHCMCGDSECIKADKAVATASIATTTGTAALTSSPTQTMTVSSPETDSSASQESQTVSLQSRTLSLASTQSPAQTSLTGWCSKWYLNPLGGGAINSIPDLMRLKPQKAVVIPAVEFVRDHDFTVVTEIQHFDRVAMTVEGSLKVNGRGEYEVCVTSDDGSHVYMDGLEIAAMPGLHPPQTGCGKRFLSAGDHGVYATFFENGGGAYLKITYKGPDTDGRTVVMPSVGFDGACQAPAAQCSCGVGWCGRFYYNPNGHGEIRDFPDLGLLVPQEAKTLLTIGLHNDGQISGMLDREGNFDHVAADFIGVLHINHAGEYTFCVTSDDGSRLYLDGRVVAASPGLHPPLKGCGSVQVKAGDHHAKVEFFENGGGAAIIVTYKGADTNDREILMPSARHSCDASKGPSGSAVALTVDPSVRTGPKGWCSKWFFNPLGGEQIVRTPDLFKLEPQRALIIPTVEFVRDDDFTKVSGIEHFDRVALTLQGTLSVQEPGEYTVCVTSDDGSRVYVDGLEIAARPGLHPPQTGCGSRPLAKGDHGVFATFFENGGGAYMKITYKGPDTGGREVVMPSVGFDGECKAHAAQCECGVGWCGYFYFNPNGHGEVRTFPDVAKLLPQEAKALMTIGFMDEGQISRMIGRVGRFDQVAAEFFGVLHVNQGGEYTVCVLSDDGSEMFIDGKSVASSPGLHPPRKGCGNTVLKTGDHHVRVTFFENGGGAAIKVTYSGADTGGKETLMPSARHTCPAEDDDEAAKPGDGRRSVDAGASQCVSMRRTACKEAKGKCQFHIACGCIPNQCTCGDAACIKSASESSAVSMQRQTSSSDQDESGGETSAKNYGTKGYCAKWYFNPLGGSQITSMPDLKRLSPQQAAVVDTVSLLSDKDFTQVTGIDHFDRVAMTFEGIVNVDEASQYEVCVTSDDGSHVYMDGSEICAMPGLHPPQTGCGKRFLSPGAHSVMATFFENGGGAYMKITWKGADTHFQTVLMPSAGFDTDCTVEPPRCSCGSGWCGFFYFNPNGHGEVRTFPDTSKLVPQEAKSMFTIGYMNDAQISSMIGRVGTFDHVAAEFHGTLRVNQAGEYAVCVLSDDGSEMFIDDSSVAAAPGLHPPRKGCGKVQLSSGYHSVRVTFFENGGGAAIKVTYSGPDTSDVEVLMPSARRPCGKLSEQDSISVSTVVPGACKTMKRKECRAVSNVCTYHSNCGCIPKQCSCGDEKCIADAVSAGAAVYSSRRSKPMSARAKPPPAFVGARPEGWSFLPNDRIELNGVPKDWATALRRQDEDIRRMRVRIRAQEKHVQHAHVGVAFLADDVDNLEAVVFRRAVRGQYAYVYHLVRVDGEEKWSQPVRAYLPKRREWFDVSVDLIRRTVSVNLRKLTLDLGFPHTQGTSIGVIGKGRDWQWEWLKIELGVVDVLPVRDVPVGSVVSLASMHRYGSYLRARGESTGLLTATVLSADVTMVEPNPSLAVSLSVGDRNFRTRGITGTSKPEWGERWEAPLSCRSLSDRVQVVLWNGAQKLGTDSFLVRVVEGSSRTLKLRIAGGGAGAEMQVQARFDCVSMGVEASQLVKGDTPEAKEASFKLVPGLSDPSMFSLESVAFPSFFLSEDRGLLRLARLPGRSSLEDGFTLALYQIDDPKLAAKALAGDERALVDVRAGVRLLVDKVSFPAPMGLREHVPLEWLNDNDNDGAMQPTVVGVLRGILDAKEKGMFTFEVSRGIAVVLVDGKTLGKDGTIKLSQGLHDIRVVAGTGEEGKGLEVSVESLLTPKGVLTGYHTASLPSAGNMEGFLRSSTFTALQGESGKVGSIQLQRADVEGRSVRLKGNSEVVWVCSVPEHMRQLRRGVRTSVYLLGRKFSSVDMPRWSYLEPSRIGSSETFSFPSKQEIESSVNKGTWCAKPPPPAPVPSPTNVGGVTVVPGAPQPHVIGEALGQICRTLRRKDCKSKENKQICHFRTACGCVPKTCSCGDGECIKAGGRAVMTATTVRSHELLTPASGGSQLSATVQELSSAAAHEKLSAANVEQSEGPVGWCSKWYYNPLGGREIRSFPELRSLSPQKAIVIPEVRFVRDHDFSHVTGLRHFDRVALTLDGVVEIIKRGKYTVCVTSDDGAYVYVDGLEIASAPGLHPPQTECGDRTLAEGVHGVFATFFENGGGAYMKITYKGPDTGGKEVIMPSVGFMGQCEAPEASCECGVGWCGKFYFDPNGLSSVTDFPDFTKLAAQEAHTMLTVGYTTDGQISSMLRREGDFDHVAVEFIGVLHVNVAGDYKICTTSDDGSRAFVNGRLVANNPGLHGPLTKCGSTRLSSDDHDVRVEFFQNGGGAAIKVTYSGPDTDGKDVLMPSAGHSCKRPGVSGTILTVSGGGQCPAMRRKECKADDACRFHTACGCIPKQCSCGDSACVKAAQASTSAVSTTRQGQDESKKPGWCTKWFFNPLGGQEIRSVPELFALNPQKAYVVPTVEFLKDDDFASVSGIDHFDRVAMTIDGVVNVKQAGTYEVCVTSDDGAHVYVDGDEICAMPGLHPPQKNCGKRYLSAGEHGVYATFFENGGGAYLRITYKGPDTGGQEVAMPSVGFEGDCEAPEAICSCGTGWCGRFYFDPNGHGEVRTFPDITKLPAQEAKSMLGIGFMNEAQISSMIGRVGTFDHVAAEFRGTLYVNIEGEYTVCVISDDGSEVFVDQQSVAAAPGLHPPQKKCGKVQLSGGSHDVRVEFFENGGGAAIKVTYTGPDTDNKEILMPSSSHSCPVPEIPAPDGCIGGLYLPSYHVGLVSKGLVDASDTGEYRFRIEGSGIAQVFVDDVMVCDKGMADSNSEGTVRLVAGTHEVVLAWYQGRGVEQSVNLLWKPPGKEAFTSVQGKRWSDRQTQSWRSARRYEYRYKDAEEASSFSFRHALYTPPSTLQTDVGLRGDAGVNLIPRGPTAVGTSCGAYLLAPGGDEKGRKTLLERCKLEDEESRGGGQCEFVDEHGFCYVQSLQALCRAHRTQVRCMTSVPSPDYASCECSVDKCTCKSVPDRNHATIMTPLPLQTDRQVLAEESRDAWAHINPIKILVARCRAQVRVAYVEMLLRPADPLGLLEMTRLCLTEYRNGNAVTVVRDQIAKKLPDLSPYGVSEYKLWHELREKVMMAFRDTLLREPKDTFELHKFAVKLKQGASEANVAAELGFSDEYDKLRNDKEEKEKRATEIAKLIYTEALMREARADEIVSTVSHLLGTGKASKIKEDIIKGEECRRWCPIRIDVRKIVREVLIREPDEGSWKMLSRKLMIGTSLDAVRQSLTSSSEHTHLNVDLDDNVAIASASLQSEMGAVDLPTKNDGPIPTPLALPPRDPSERSQPMVSSEPSVPSGPEPPVPKED